MKHYPLELLSPARDLACGLAAIDHGADAVYIGAPRFSARSAAGNSLADIEKLVNYAHRFFARVYIALNTLLTDRELDEAVRLVHQLYTLGADALIVQDMGLLECELPPIPLHASTQTNNRSLEKVRFLEGVGFEQVVLARELSLGEIQAIRDETRVALECFIHGALCVSYSGQCYISEVVSGRSANRGECAQFCRHLYTLRDGNDRVVAKDRYLLSLKDLDLSARLEELIGAGVSSFKIEGRLKDINYVKNITAWYRRLLDRQLEKHPHLAKSSSGKCDFSFTPDPAKSFNRGQTEYFLDGPPATPGQPDTSKSLGEPLGTVEVCGKNSFTLKTTARLSNGDGLCYQGQDGTLVGLKANRIEGTTVYHREHYSPPVATLVYRNYDVAFLKELKRSGQCRRVAVELTVQETSIGLSCTVVDEDGCSSTQEVALTKEKARRQGSSSDVISRQMKKSGGTVFQVNQVAVKVADDLFVGAATINELRRASFSHHLDVRQRAYRPPRKTLVPNSVPWLSARVTCLDNITNGWAATFYRRHGVTDFAFAGGGAAAESNLPLMTTRYCPLAQLRMCPKMSGNKARRAAGPLTLIDKTGSYTLDIHCDRCEMTLKKAKGGGGDSSTR